MAPRAFWKGYLKFSLVTCPVALTPAVSQGERLRFHTLNAGTGNRLRSRWIDSVTGETVPEGKEARAYFLEEDRPIILEDDEIEAVALESTRTIDIETFVPADSIGWIWLDRPHYLVPDDKSGEEAFVVIREAMKATGKVGIARLVLHRRERAVMVEPRGRGLILWTLRYGDEVREAADYFEGLDEAEPDGEALDLLTTLIEARTRDWTPAMVRDPVQARLAALVEKKKGEQAAPRGRRKAKEPPAEAGNVVSITDALRRSIEREKKSRQRR
jgi:DNA end-binding protein Ku